MGYVGAPVLISVVKESWHVWQKTRTMETLGNSTETTNVNGIGRKLQPMAESWALPRKDSKARLTAKLTLAELGGADDS